MPDYWPADDPRTYHRATLSAMRRSAADALSDPCVHVDADEMRARMAAVDWALSYTDDPKPGPDATAADATAHLDALDRWFERFGAALISGWLGDDRAAWREVNGKMAAIEWVFEVWDNAQLPGAVTSELAGR